ncbi:MAG: ABC transporter ATP-binding protein [Thermotogae bacterium]|nr:ABC transporter ATP-binding protein [Thermotogota bacterium]
MNEENIIEVRNLIADFEVKEGILRSVDHVDLDIKKGKVTGLIGESGCGKSTLVHALLNLNAPNEYIREGSQVNFKGRNIFSLSAEELRRLRWREAALVFQAAQNSLNPTITIKEQMLDTIEAHLDHGDALSKKKGRIPKLLEMVRLEPERVLKSFPHELSGGMKQRTVIAMALLLDPEILILDEPTTALDMITQSYILDIFADIHEKLGVTMFFVTHDLSLAAKLAERLAIMYAGKILEVGSVEEIFYKAYHPYTIGLIKSMPSIIGDLSQMKPIPGLPPNLLHKPSGCLFHPRCPEATEECKKVEPKLIEIEKGHLVACHKYSNVKEKGMRS